MIFCYTNFEPNAIVWLTNCLKQLRILALRTTPDQLLERANLSAGRVFSVTFANLAGTWAKLCSNCPGKRRKFTGLVPQSGPGPTMYKGQQVRLRDSNRRFCARLAKSVGRLKKPVCAALNSAERRDVAVR